MTDNNENSSNSAVTCNSYFSFDALMLSFVEGICWVETVASCYFDNVCLQSFQSSLIDTNFKYFLLQVQNRLIKHYNYSFISQTVRLF